MTSGVKFRVLYFVIMLLLFCKSVSASDSDLVWSTFLGGSDGDTGEKIAVDDSGCAYVVGCTRSIDFPTTSGAIDTTYDGIGIYSDIFVVKINDTGSALEYATYLGGGTSPSIAVDDLGNAYLTGDRYGPNPFPITPGAYDTTLNDIFITKINSTGNALCFSTYLGGSNPDDGRGISIDSTGNVYIVGKTESVDFPIIEGAFDTTLNGVHDAFIAKFNSSGTSLEYSTYIGGSASDVGTDIAVDEFGKVYLIGRTTSLDFPTTLGALDTNYNTNDAFVCKLDLDLSVLAYSTYLGGSRYEDPTAIALDDSGNAHITGFTNSLDFPSTPWSFDTTYNGDEYDAFVSKLNKTGSALCFSTYLGGSDEDRAYDITIDAAGNTYVAGYGRSDDYPVTQGAFDTSCFNCANEEAFMTKLFPTGQALAYSTFIGGLVLDRALGIAVDTPGNVYLTGVTQSDDFPTTEGAFDRIRNEGDAYIMKLDVGGGDLTPPLTIDDLIIRLHSGMKSYGGNIYLSWSEPFDSVGVHHYVIYRNDSPQELGDSLTTTTNTSYLDEYVYAIGKPNLNYYYTVKAVDYSGNKSEASNQVGEFDKVLRW